MSFFAVWMTLDDPNPNTNSRTSGQLRQLTMNRFRGLKYLGVSDLQLSAAVVATACVLHNLCIDNYDDAEVERHTYCNGKCQQC